jgi:hypothetical protein
MSKKSKIAKSTPDCYVGLVSDPKNLRRCLIEDNNMVYSLFENPHTLESLQSYEAMIKPEIAKRWNNFDHFVETVNEQTLLCYHENLFSVPVPKKQDLIVTQLHVWHKMCSLCKNTYFANMIGTPKDPTTQRKSTILTCVYSPGEVTEGAADIKTFQALKSLQLFRDCLLDRTEVTEGELKQYVIDRADVLKTRQDPWRIFQYYRPQLIAAKLLRRK